MMGKFKLIVMIGVVMVVLFGCSSGESKYSPDQVIKNALEKTSSLESYYAEVDMITKENGEVIEESQMKEWKADDGRARIETENKDGSDQAIAVNDGKTIMTYVVEENQVFQIDGEGILDQPQQSLKEQVQFYLEGTRETHDIKAEGEEEVAGRKAHHFTATPKKDGTLLGEQEIWIDQENWLVLKMILKIGDTEIEMIYKKVDIDPAFSEDIFELDLPDDVEFEDLDSMFDTSEIPLEEVAENVGQPVLYFPEKDGLEILMIEKTELEGELGRTEVQIDYHQDGQPFMSMFVFETPEDVEGDIDFPDEGSITIRNVEGSIMDESVMRLLSWQEDGVSYSVDLQDSDLTFEDVVQMADDMELIE